MLDVTINPFSNSNYLSARETTKNIATPECRLPPPASLVASWNNQDDYVQAVTPAAVAYKRPAVSAASSASGVSVPGEEVVPQGTVTDRMRAEMTLDDGSHWSARGLVSAAQPTINGIVNQVFEEMGVNETIYYKGCSYNYSINPDGVFIFHPEDLRIDGVDLEFAEEICLALESAANSSSLNMKDNPQLFTQDWIPPEYEPATWGRSIDRDEWINDRYPDFSEYASDLRSDILELFDGLDIVDFTMKIDDQGKLTVTSVQTSGPHSESHILQRMNNQMSDEIKDKAEYLGLLLLSVQFMKTEGGVVRKDNILDVFHTDDKGIVPEYRYEIQFTSGSNYNLVRSADQPGRVAPEWVPFQSQKTATGT